MKAVVYQTNKGELFYYTGYNQETIEKIKKFAKEMFYISGINLYISKLKTYREITKGGKIAL